MEEGASMMAFFVSVVENLFLQPVSSKMKSIREVFLLLSPLIGNLLNAACLSFVFFTKLETMGNAWNTIVSHLDHNSLNF